MSSFFFISRLFDFTDTTQAQWHVGKHQLFCKTPWPCLERKTFKN